MDELQLAIVIARHICPDMTYRSTSDEDDVIVFTFARRIGVQPFLTAIAHYPKLWAVSLDNEVVVTYIDS